MIRTSLLRQLPTTSSRAPRVLAASLCPLAQRRTSTQQQVRRAHAISNPTLANIEKRWEAMPPQEQADVWMALRDRMKADWNDLTIQEKKAAYWIAFGPHGPRALPPPGENWTVLLYTMYAVGAAGAVFALARYFARPPPRTLTKEWQEAQTEWMREKNIEPITGLSSEGYKGKGMVQSPPGPPGQKGADDD